MQYTVLEINSIRELTQQYDIGAVDSFRVLSGGSENTNYLIDSKSEKYVLTICEQKSTTEANHLSLLLEHLDVNDFSTSKIVRTKKNDLISIFKNKPIILKSFLEGKIIKNLSNHLLILIGIQLGKLNKIKAPKYLPKRLNYGIEHFDEVSIYAKDSTFHHWLNKIQKQITPFFAEALPQALIHSDVFYSNVIVENDERSVTIMDFEEAVFYYRIFDISMAIVGLCCEGEMLNLKKVSHLLKGYTSEIELTDVEQNALQPFTLYAAAAVSFWRHKNFNYTKLTPSMKYHYLELKKIADSVNDLPSQCFKKLLHDLT